MPCGSNGQINWLARSYRAVGTAGVAPGASLRGIITSWGGYMTVDQTLGV